MNSTDLKNAELVTRSLQLLRGRWTVPILFALCNHPVRLSALRRAIPGASKKALTASLRSLEASQIVVRKDLSKSVLHVEYELAEGTKKSLTTLFGCLAEWRNTAISAPGCPG
jgi:DNA-binding HxlR family transcriptional regulator